MQNLIKEFAEARKALIAALNKFPKEKIEEKLFDKWSLKEVVAHFTGWDRYFTQAVKLLKQKKTMPFWESVRDFNENSVKRAVRVDWKKIYQEFVKVGDKFIEEYQKIPSELANRLFWKNKKYTPLDFLKINIGHYKNNQTKEIFKLLKKWRRPEGSARREKYNK